MEITFNNVVAVADPAFSKRHSMRGISIHMPPWTSHCLCLHPIPNKGRLFINSFFGGVWQLLEGEGYVLLPSRWGRSQNSFN